jgi:amino acid transporter
MKTAASTRPAIAGTAEETRALAGRNRRLALLLGIGVVIFTLLCAVYIFFLGGANKGPMKPFHSHHAAAAHLEAV